MPYWTVIIPCAQSAVLQWLESRDKSLEPAGKPFQLLQRTVKPFRASARNCLIRSIGSWHCCPAAVLDDQPSVPSRGLAELRQLCWRIGLRMEFLNANRCKHVNYRSFRSLFRHPRRSAAERPSENRETEH